MEQTRREFLITSAAAISVFRSAAAQPPLSDPKQRPCQAPALLEGDPYTAHVDDHGLGGRSFDQAYHHALRFRSTAEGRDRYVLGLEF